MGTDEEVESDLPTGTFPPMVALSTGIVQISTDFTDDEVAEGTKLAQNTFNVVLKDDTPGAALGFITAIQGRQVITVFGMANIAVIESDSERQAKVFGEDEIRAKFIGSPAHKALYSAIRTAIMTVAGLIDHDMALPYVAPIDDCKVDILHADDLDYDEGSDTEA